MAPQPNHDGAPPAGDKLIGLEALRFIAAFAVLVWHYRHFLYVGLEPSGFVRENEPFHVLLAPFHIYGYAGVELFWCISGFIFAWKYGETLRKGGMSLTRFMVLRFSRLYPLHLVTLLAVAAGQWLYFHDHGQYFLYGLNDLKHFLLSLAFASYWGFQDGQSFNGPSWSISAEILVYVLFFALSRRITPGLWSAVAITVGVSVVASLLRTTIDLKLAIFGAATFFYLGVVTSHLHALIEARPRAEHARYALLSLAVVIVSVALVYAGVLKIAGASLVLFPALILLFQRVLPRARGGTATALGFLGDLTYASYMIHFPLQLGFVMLMERAGIDIRPLFYTHGFFLAYILTVFGLARLVFRGFERPAQTAMRRAFLGSYGVGDVVPVGEDQGRHRASGRPMSY